MGNISYGFMFQRETLNFLYGLFPLIFFLIGKTFCFVGLNFRVCDQDLKEIIFLL